jgi:transcriptional regulator with XRE-family HTH domain
MHDGPNIAKPDINTQIAARVRQLRADRHMSLEALATRSKVSRSMISLIERAETSPTAVVLEKLAAGLDVTLASLFEFPGHLKQPVARLTEQPSWRDPASGYLRRNVSPAGDPVQIVEIVFPAGAHVNYETSRRQPVIHHQVWVLDGDIEVTVGTVVHELAKGDCLAFILDQPTAYRNRTSASARYAVVIVNQPDHGR